MTEEKRAAAGSIGDEAVLSVVAPILLDKRFNEIMAENARLRATLARVRAGLAEKCGYALDLVWYARSAYPAEHPLKQKISAKYPEQVAALVASETNWQHGFNSGCLAARRLVTDLLGADRTVAKINANLEEDEDDDVQICQEGMTVEAYAEQVLEDFPMLDT